MKQTYFITATGTDLGKTWLSGELLAVLVRRGVAVRAVKPLMSGYDATAPARSDAGVLLEKLGAETTAAAVAAIAPWRFAAPLSPDRAAALENRQIDYETLLGWCRAQQAASEGWLLIEGIGGVMVPLDARHTVRDWIAALAVPTLLLAGSYLGALSHTLTALAALRDVGVAPRALVLIDSGAASIGLDLTRASLEPHLHGTPLVMLGRDDGAGVERLADHLIGSDTSAAWD